MDSFDSHNEDNQIKEDTTSEFSDEHDNQEPSKKRPGLIIAFVLLIILFLLAVCCLVVYFGHGYFFRESSETTITVTEEVEEDILDKRDLESGEETTNTDEKSDEGEEGEDFYFYSRNGGTEDVMVLKNVKFGQHPGYERMILEFVSQKNIPRSGVPRYITNLGKLPYIDAQENMVSIKGHYFFEINFNGDSVDFSVDTAPKIYQGPDVFNLNYLIIKQAKFIPAYEDHTLIILVGLNDRNPYRILELKKPPRIVVDFKK